MYNKLKNFVLFIGYGRSGHTLVGSLIDAHKNAIISNEFHLSRFFYNYKKKEKLYDAIIDASKRQKELPGGRAERTIYPDKKVIKYAYNVPNQWQGVYTELFTIGDKKGDNFCIDFDNNPKILDDIHTLTNLPLKLIHVIRNPYDNIATIGMNRMNVYIDLVRIVANIKKLDYPILDVYSEDLIKYPRKNLIRIAEFLDLSPTEDWLNDCSSIIFDKPNKSRDKVGWSKERKETVENLISKYDFLNRYKNGLTL